MGVEPIKQTLKMVVEPFESPLANWATLLVPSGATVIVGIFLSPWGWAGLLGFLLALTFVAAVRLQMQLGGEYPDLDVTATVEYRPGFEVINNGPTDSFQVAVDRKYFSWERTMEYTITETELVRGAHGFASGFLPKDRKFKARFLSRDRKPLDLEFETRTTVLGRRQVRPADGEWEPKHDGNWIDRVGEALSIARNGVDRLKSLGPNTKNISGAMHKEIHSAIGSRNVTAGDFDQPFYRVNRRLGVTERGMGNEAPPEEWRTEYVKVVEWWRDCLQIVFDAGTDDPDVVTVPPSP